MRVENHRQLTNHLSQCLKIALLSNPRMHLKKNYMPEFKVVIGANLQIFNSDWNH